MPRIIMSYPNSNSFACDMKVEKGLEGEVGSVFSVVANKLTMCHFKDLFEMKYDSILESQIIIEVEGTNIDIKWNNLDNPINQLRAIGEFLRVQAFKMWMIPVMPSKVVLPHNPYQFRS